MLRYGFLIMVLLNFCNASVGKADRLPLGDHLGPLTLHGLGDYEHHLTDYSQHPATVLVFLSARCPAVESQLPALLALHERQRHDNVRYVGLVVDPQQSPDEIRTWMQRRGIIFPIYRDREGSIARQLGAAVTPHLFVFDDQGRLKYRGGISHGVALDRLEQVVGALVHAQEGTFAEEVAQGSPIDAQLPSRHTVDLWGDMFCASELISLGSPGAAAVHCSTLCEAANGDLLGLWYGGSFESADDQALYLVRRPRGSRAWSVPQRLLEDPLRPPGNAILFVDGRQRLWLLWARLEAPRPILRGSGWDRCRLMARVSVDHGLTWSPDQPVPLPDGTWTVPRNVPCRTTAGRIVVPLEAVHGSQAGSLFLTSDDQGDTWQTSSLLLGGSQPTVVARSDGSLLALFRQAPLLTTSTSPDQGLSWSPWSPTAIPNPDAGIAMTRLHNGDLWLVFNNSSEDRTPLSIMRSQDEGRSWQTPLHLESNPGEYSYPCIVQTKDQRIHITYTFRRYGIKHVELSEAWLTNFEHPN